MVIRQTGEDGKYLILVVLKDILIMAEDLRTIIKSHKNATLKLFQESKIVENVGRCLQRQIDNTQGGSKGEKP